MYFIYIVSEPTAILERQLNNQFVKNTLKATYPFSNIYGFIVLLMTQSK